MTDEQREQDEREMARALFGERPEPLQLPDLDARPEPRKGNHVPAEGATAGPTRPADYDERNFVGSLFGRPQNARNLEDPNDYPHRTAHL